MTPALHFTHFGKYEIIRKLGRSLSDVYLALDPEMNRRAVLKIIEHCHDSYTQLIVDAERRGAAIQQQLHSSDPRILEIYEVGEQDGCFFVAMEYAEGRSLAELLRQKTRLDHKCAAQYALEIVDQLASLHAFQIDLDGNQRAVVHGDIKPSNVQISPEGDVRLLDFGIAKAISATRNMTSHNLGSPAYCSPERLKNGQVNPHADLWAAGVCLYEMIAGIPPYQAETTRKLENLIQSRRPPRALPSSCPPALRAIIWKALAADAARRYPSASAFAEDLSAFLAAKPTAAEREKQPAWDANATIQGPQSHATTIERRRSRPWDNLKLTFETELIVWSLVGGLLVGFCCFAAHSWYQNYWLATAPIRAHKNGQQLNVAEINKDWQIYSDLRARYAWLGTHSPANTLGNDLEARTVAFGDRIIEEYRDGAATDASTIDWEKAKSCFGHALEFKPGDASLKAKLAVVSGYILLSRDPMAAKGRFDEAVRLQPKWPDPHLGLAHIALLHTHNLGLGTAELKTAERLGYAVGPRETEQLGDAFLFRAEQQLRAAVKSQDAIQKDKLLSMARRDLDRARDLYEPVSGFSNVDQSLQRIEKDRALFDAPIPKARIIPARHVTRQRRRSWR